MKRKQKAIKALKIIGAIIYLLTTIFLIIMLVSLLADYFEGNEHWKLGGVFVFVITLAASCAYIIPIIMGGVGTAIAIKAKDRKSKIYFLFMIFVPIITALANLITYMILLKS